jgi:ABC-2 type transport system permease protein
MTGRFGEVMRHETVLIRSEPVPVLIFLVMPVVLMAFVENTFGLFLRFVEGVPGISGAALAVPGQVTLFAFMSTATLGYYYLGDHTWGTWARSRSLGVSDRQLVGGKLSVAYAHQLVQMTLLLGFGSLAFQLRVAGSLGALALLVAAFGLFVTAYGFLACVFARSQAQFNAFAYLGALLIAGLGGALTPFESLPGWVQAIGRFSPSHWAIEGFRRIIIGGGGMSSIDGPLLELLAGSAVVTVIAMIRFDPDERKSTYA